MVAVELVASIKELNDLDSLQSLVHKSIKSVTEVFDAFVPSKEEFTDPIVDAYLNGNII